MTVHTDTKALQTYTPSNYPSISGGEAIFLTNELEKIQTVIKRLIDVVRMLETRMNTNGLT